MSIEEIEEKIEEYFDMNRGSFVAEQSDIIDVISDIFVTRRSIKHVTEQRKVDRYPRARIIEMYRSFALLHTENMLEVHVKDEKTKIFVEIDPDNMKSQILIAVSEISFDKEILKTIFYKPKRKVKNYISNQIKNKRP